MNNDYGQYRGPQEAKAITWAEFMRRGGGGGGGGGDDDDTTWLGRKFREWACKLIQREQDSLDDGRVKPPVEFAAAFNRKKELVREFNRISEEPGIDVTLDAVRTVLRYNLGLTAPART